MEWLRSKKITISMEPFLCYNGPRYIKGNVSHNDAILVYKKFTLNCIISDLVVLLLNVPVNN